MRSVSADGSLPGDPDATHEARNPVGPAVRADAAAEVDHSPPLVTACASPGLSRKVPDPVSLIRDRSTAMADAFPPARASPVVKSMLGRSNRCRLVAGCANTTAGPPTAVRAP